MLDTVLVLCVMGADRRRLRYNTSLCGLGRKQRKGHSEGRTKATGAWSQVKRPESGTPGKTMGEEARGTWTEEEEGESVMLPQ